MTLLRTPEGMAGFSHTRNGGGVGQPLGVARTTVAVGSGVTVAVAVGGIGVGGSVAVAVGLGSGVGATWATVVALGVARTVTGMSPWAQEASSRVIKMTNTSFRVMCAFSTLAIFPEAKLGLD